MFITAVKINGITDYDTI